MIYSKQDIKALSKVDRIRLINSASGIKPGNLIGTINNLGVTNLAIFSSVVHLGSEPALFGFITRPTTVPRHTLANIKENGCYTINHIHPQFIKNAHYTSTKLEVSEFEACKLTEEYIGNFKAPYVKESQFKMGLEFKEEIDIPINGTKLIVGEVQYIVMPNNILLDLDLEALNGVGISGLNNYYSLSKIGDFPYARADEFPNF